ncbi:MAG: dTDP-4-dehydrorhamnose 3,5-epimerase family protein [Saprospiraceae bacterium]|nr:dTDP-4-dehydrorhamnose 3,5-epimerase family protein [Saprospiraceae bacterium]
MELSESNKQKLYIPKGFAHGFQSISEYAEINYLVSQFYHKDSEGIIHYNDPLLDIQWPLQYQLYQKKIMPQRF